MICSVSYALCYNSPFWGDAVNRTPKNQLTEQQNQLQCNYKDHSDKVPGISHGEIQLAVGNWLLKLINGIFKTLP